MIRSVFKDYSQSVVALMENRIVLCNQSIIDQIYQTSLPNTPYRRGDLRSNVRKTAAGHDGVITWQVDYAAYQERGSNPDGSRPVRNYTTPGTGPWYAKNAVATEVKKIGEYWERASRSVTQNRLY